ncbi:hypothetical protein ACFQPA_07435 [Halomarina halobia]|uniref:Uncharacterized protein n=1 Tax=Halomarina halobia TaxID=3033386 RepID=A0ABD6ABX8_9EURY|nr:hypothetical protein [Halomarina sp. PSR21]
MNVEATAVHGTVGVVLLALVLTGPYGPIDATASPSDGFGSGEGTADVRDVRLPEAATLERGRYGETAYALSVPPATATVTGVTGRPILVYEVRIADLGYSRVSLTSLDAGVDGRVRLTVAADAFAPDRIDRRRYEATVSVTLRSGEERTVVDRATVPVEVIG